MDQSLLGMVVALVVLIAMSAYFSATETAFSSLNRIRMKSRAESGDARAAQTLKLSEDYDRLLSTILIGNNIVNITATTVGTVLFTKLVGAYGPTLSTVVLTVAILIFGEISPKSIAKERPEQFAMAATPALRFFLSLLRPLNFLFAQWKRLLRRVIHTGENSGITEEELITMVTEAESEGGIDENESELIRSAIEFGDLEAEDILTPRVEICSISLETDFETIEKLFAESGFSRLPVYRERVDDIVGVLHEKDFHTALRQGDTDIRQCMGAVHYASANTPAADLLRTLQRKKLHMAVVVDEYGGTEGIVTLEDILEELVGEIWDEHDVVEEPIQLQSDGSYLVDCSAGLRDLYDRFSVRCPDCDASTVSGWVIEQLERLPQVGDRFTVDGLEVTVMRASNRKVLEIRVRVLPESLEEET